jgi:hypothetical protein
VDWAGDRFTVRSSKTAHHDGGGIRQTPIFRELLPYLREAYDQAPEGEIYCCPQYENACQMYRKIVEAAVKRAGLTPWPKLFQNLRSTRETELCRNYPIHNVTKWLGNSPNIAIRHYLQTTDADYKEAAQHGARAAQKAAQQPAVMGRKELHGETCTGEKAPISPENADFVGDSAYSQNTSLGGTGLEPVTSCV